MSSGLFGYVGQLNETVRWGVHRSQSTKFHLRDGGRRVGTKSVFLRLCAILPSPAVVSVVFLFWKTTEGSSERASKSPFGLSVSEGGVRVRTGRDTLYPSLQRKNFLFLIRITVGFVLISRRLLLLSCLFIIHPLVVTDGMINKLYTSISVYLRNHVLSCTPNH